MRKQGAGRRRTRSGSPATTRTSTATPRRIRWICWTRTGPMSACAGRASRWRTDVPVTSHWWLETSTIKRGMGNNQFGDTRVEWDDQQSKYDTFTSPGEIQCKQFPDADESCVNSSTSGDLGRWLPWNTCHDSVNSVLKKCAKNPKQSAAFHGCRGRSGKDTHVHNWYTRGVLTKLGFSTHKSRGTIAMGSRWLRLAKMLGSIGPSDPWCSAGECHDDRRGHRHFAADRRYGGFRLRLHRRWPAGQQCHAQHAGVRWDAVDDLGDRRRERHRTLAVLRRRQFIFQRTAGDVQPDGFVAVVFVYDEQPTFRAGLCCRMCSRCSFSIRRASCR